MVSYFCGGNDAAAPACEDMRGGVFSQGNLRKNTSQDCR